MRLLRLSLRNFKGIKTFTLEANGTDVSVWGDNATGKTTLFDSFCYLLFDKDSANRKDFEIKTLGENGEAAHNLEHEVAAVLEVDGREVQLRKVYSEQWTKKRGSARATFTGHTTDCFVNGVPVKKADYVARIAEICDEDTFKLLTSPTYFNEQLHWERRRQVLLDVCGDVSDVDVIASDKALANLPDILGNRSLEDHRKVIAARRREINDELEKIPVRIDEIERGLPDVTGLDRKALTKQIESLTAERQEADQELARIEAGGEIAEKTKALREVEANLLDLKTEHRRNENEATEAKEFKLRALTTAVATAEDSASQIIGIIQRKNDEITSLEEEASALRKDWHTEDGKGFDYPAYSAPDVADTCPACGRSLPADQIEAAQKKAEEDYNHTRAAAQEAFDYQKKATLARLTEAGKKKKAVVEAVREEIEENDRVLREYQCAAQSRRDEADDLAAKIESARTTLPLEDSPEYKALVAEKAAIELAIVPLQEGAADAANSVRERIQALGEEVMRRTADVSAFDQRDTGKARVDELAAQEKTLAAEFERLEEELFLADEFIRAKVGFLEKKINSRFSLARFKLFNQLVNGGVEECCELTVGGVPYSSLNNGARINAGLDIIQTLAQHYGFSAPIFIDNAEAVSQLTPIDSQLITLFVSEKDKKLRVVPEKTKEVA